MKNNLTSFSQIQPSNSNYINRTVKINGIDFEEQLISKLLQGNLSTNIEKATVVCGFLTSITSYFSNKLRNIHAVFS